MNIQTAVKTQIVPPLSSINSYGGSITSFEGIKGRLLSALHWNSRYDEHKTLDQYVVWVGRYGKTEESKNIPKDYEAFFGSLKALKGEVTQAELLKIDPRHVVLLIEVFGSDQAKLKFVFAAYKELTNELRKTPGNEGRSLDIQAFISAAKAELAQTEYDDASVLAGDIKAILEKKGSLLDTVRNEVPVVYNGIIWEIAVAFWGYKYEALPIINLTLNALTGNTLFSGFWGFFFAGYLAEMSVPTVGAAIKGLYTGEGELLNGVAEAWKAHEKEKFFHCIIKTAMASLWIASTVAIKSVAEAWKDRVEDENTFHPFVETAMASLWISSTWLYIEKLQNAAKAGDILYRLMQLGIKDYILKYSTMHFYFSCKAALHKGAVSVDVLKSALMGAIRGAIKNPIASSFSSYIGTHNLSEGLYLQNLPVFYKDAYVRDWISLLPESIFTSTFTTTESLVTALWVAKDAFEVLLVNTSSILANSIMGLLGPEYRARFLTVLLLGVLAYYNTENAMNSFSNGTVQMVDSL